MKKQITNIGKIIKLLQGEYDLSKMRDYCIDEINRKIREYMKSKRFVILMQKTNYQI